MKLLQAIFANHGLTRCLKNPHLFGNDLKKCSIIQRRTLALFTQKYNAKSYDGNFSIKHFSNGHCSIKDALDASNIGKKLSIQGWVKSHRKQKLFSFIEVDDGLTLGGKKLQVICDSDKIQDGIKYHSAIKVTGTLIKSDHPMQEVELQADEIKLMSPMTNSKYPFQPRKKYDDEHPRNFPHFRAKLNDFSTMLRIRSALTFAIHEYFQSQNFIQIQTPVLTSNDCEGAGEQFLVTPANSEVSKVMKKTNIEDLNQAYFDKKTFLTVSGQLHLEAICNGIEKVYTFNPAFRAEKGRTRRHLSEFCMIEAEVAFLENHEDLLSLQENLIKKSLQKVLDSHQKDIEYYLYLSDLKFKANEANLNHLNKVLNNEFIIMTYQEALDILDKNRNEFKAPVDPNDGLGKEHETFLAEKYTNGVPIFIIDWPKNLKAFYARSKSENVVEACDLLFPSVGELCGGALREHDYEILESNIKKLGIEGLDWYLDLRSSGAAPMGGFGLGFERLVQFLLKTYNIRDTIPFSRRPHDCKL